VAALDSRARLIAEYPYLLRVIKSVVQKISPNLREECESEALVAMVEAADAWHPGGLTFRQFVSTRLEQRMIDEARRSGGLKRGKSSSRDAYSLDAQAGQKDESRGATHGDLLEAKGPARSDPHDRAVAQERIEALAELPPRWQIALTLDVAEAADTLGVSESRVHQLRSVVRRVLREDEPVAVPVELLAPLVGTPITRSELAVLHLLATGDTTTEIADHLDISFETVKNHLQHLVAKLAARNRTHAIDLAWNADWWDEPEMGARRPPP
jgi:DNA-binding CsgD family transcriptional regulator/DNA-directed RNA polymerase specialized sigma subunit